MVLLAVMPLGMSIAHRSSPLFLGLSALFAFAALACEGGVRAFFRETSAAMRTPLGMAVLTFAAWSFLSLTWSEVRDTSASALFEFWLPVVFAFVLALTLSRRVTPGAFWLLAISVTAAQLLMLIDLRTGLSVRRALGMRWDSYIFNRPSLTLLVLLPPLVGWLLGTVRSGQALSLAFLAVIALAIFNSDSGAATLGLPVAILAYLAVWIAPRMAIRLGQVLIVATLVLAPIVGPLADRLIPASVHEHLAANHSRDRVDIWLSFDAAIHEDPMLGAGFGVSPRLGETTIAARVPPERRVLLSVGHPHNAALQIWVELGLVGALLAGLVGVLTLSAIGRQPTSMKALSLALAAGAVAVAMVGHGAWQGWWAAALGAAVVWLRALRLSREINR